jgi:hypothetical protein
MKAARLRARGFPYSVETECARHHFFDEPERWRAEFHFMNTKEFEVYLWGAANILR